MFVIEGKLKKKPFQDLNLNFILEEDGCGVNALMPSVEEHISESHFRNNTHDGNRPSGRKPQTLVH